MDLTEYLVSLKKLQLENKRTGDDGKKRFELMGKGLEAAKGSMRDLVGSAKQGLATVATLGGAFSIAGGVQGAVRLNAKYREIAFNASKAGEKAVEYAEVQGIVERASTKTSRELDEMATAFGDLVQGTGDLQFSTAILASLGTAANAAHTDVATLVPLADQLKTKFGLATEAIPDALARIVDHSRQGGPKLGEFADVASTLGANLMEAGMGGSQALDFLLGSLVKLDDGTGDLGKAVKGVQQLLLNLTKGDEVAALAKDLAIDPKTLLNEKDVIDRLSKILSFGKRGLDALKANFVGPEERKALRILFTQPFEEALQRAKASGLKGKDAVDQALRVMQEGIEAFGDSNFDAAEMAKLAAKEQESPQARLRAAMNALNKAFETPEVIDAITELSKALPQLAEILGDLVSFAAKHPVLAGAGFVGAKAAGSAGSAMLGEVASRIIDGHSKGAKAAGEALLDKLKAGMPTVSATGGGAMALAFKAASVAAAGAIGFEIGTAIAPYLISDEGFKKERETEGGTEAAIANAAGGGSAAAMRERLKRLEAALDTESKAKLGSGFIDSAVATFGGPDAAAASKERLARGEAAANDLRWRIREKTIEEARGSSTVTMEPETIRGGKVALDSGAPRQIAGALSTALGGKVLSVRIVNGGEGGITARAQGTRGPRPTTPPMPSGGV